MIEAGEIAVVHLTGRTVDGTVFETTDVDVALDERIYHDHRDYKPLEFRVGEGHVLPGIDDAVQDMRSGETRTVVLDPEDAYGERDDEAVVTVPRSKLESRSETTAELGELVRSRTNDIGWIVDVDDETATIDFNHELAGKRVEFEIRILEVHGRRSTKLNSSERGSEA
ncbi:FKBP-type peptidylprolyl isomerase [Halogeometricum pallidum JCM 14848]|uniref:Peptidyl-prolyl cis-trans isomerase n=1 Tax=Halogeometricum pallidum JCM 14848 TaxID=1227487 RepID=M0D3C4_HALPD|nr:FKBP-type peptidyl-prolyl cis-trans isomerase [Halogeometricum pallidum]ELZ28649.1 FKBP-type peptidylprolyl isomerase [Halogeometricum pallidum JCM 14848]